MADSSMNTNLEEVVLKISNELLQYRKGPVFCIIVGSDHSLVVRIKSFFCVFE